MTCIEGEKERRKDRHTDKITEKYSKNCCFFVVIKTAATIAGIHFCVRPREIMRYFSVATVGTKENTMGGESRMEILFKGQKEIDEKNENFSTIFKFCAKIE